MTEKKRRWPEIMERLTKSAGAAPGDGPVYFWTVMELLGLAPFEGLDAAEDLIDRMRAALGEKQPSDGCVFLDHERALLDSVSR